MNIKIGDKFIILNSYAMLNKHVLRRNPFDVGQTIEIVERDNNGLLVNYNNRGQSWWITKTNAIKWVEEGHWKYIPVREDLND